jgi:iron complex transport system ATP-binding protein
MLIARELGFHRGPRQILSGVAVTLSPGRLTVLLGPNGAGKSTLLKLLAGELTPSVGGVELDGRRLGRWTPGDLARRRAVLPQESRLAFAFPVRDVVMMGRMPHARRGESPRDEEICTLALTRTGAGDLADRLYPALSGGEQQRVQLARVLAQVWEPQTGVDRLLLLDEPTANLDLAHQHSALSLAREWARAGAAVLAVLHDLNLALTYADDAWVLDHGQLVAAGPIQEVLTKELIASVFHLHAEFIPYRGCERPVISTRPL